jgi:5-methylcytosine-specific restriction enzyme subunit McrC
MASSSGDRTIVECFERQAVGLPISALLNAKGEIDILPEVQGKGYFDIDFRGNRLTFVAGKYVGLIPVTSAVCIHVRPKVEIADLTRMLAVAEGELGVLPFFTRGYEGEGSPDQAVTILIVRTLLKQLQAIVTQGLYKTYTPFRGSGTFRSRIDFSRSISKEWAHGRVASSAWNAFQFGANNALNRLIKYTLWYCGGLLQAYSGTKELRKEIGYLYELFHLVPLDLNRGFLEEARDKLRQVRFPQIRHYYSEICSTCLFLIGNRSISLSVPSGEVDLLSFILNLEDLFEWYVRNVIRLALHKGDVQILDGNREGRSFLFNDSRAMEVKPDVVVKIRHRTRLVIDAKYKHKVNEGDRYQIITHAYSAGAEIALFVIPSFGQGPRGLIRRGRIGIEQPLEHYEYHFPLDSDLIEQEGALVAAVAALVELREPPGTA